MKTETQKVYDFWNEASCGEALYLTDQGRDAYEAQSRVRYELEPMIPVFAEFERFSRKEVLEIGVGLGADHQRFAEAGAVLSGIDLTHRAIQHTKRRFAHFGLTSNLRQHDAENLPFENGRFDLVYSWGVIMCAPDTERVVHEIHRVIKPGGRAKIMIYHKYSFVGYMLWLRYALLGLRPWIPLGDIYQQYLESPGTKAYSVRQARRMFASFRDVRITTELCHADLLTSRAGQRHEGPLLALARRMWPRALIRKHFSGHGLFMMIDATK